LGRLETADGAERVESPMSVDAAGAAGATDATGAAGATGARGRDDDSQVHPAAAVRGQGANADTRAAIAGEGAADTPGARLTRLSPAVRRLLQERGLDPSTIQGSGEDGR